MFLFHTTCHMRTLVFPWVEYWSTIDHTEYWWTDCWKLPVGILIKSFSKLKEEKKTSICGRSQLMGGQMSRWKEKMQKNARPQHLNFCPYPCLRPRPRKNRGLKLPWRWGFTLCCYYLFSFGYHLTFRQNRWHLRQISMLLQQKIINEARINKWPTKKEFATNYNVKRHKNIEYDKILISSV